MFQQHKFHSFASPSVSFTPKEKEVEIEEVMDYSEPVPQKIVKPRYLPGERLLKTLNSKAKKKKNSHVKSSIEDILTDLNL